MATAVIMTGNMIELRVPSADWNLNSSNDTKPMYKLEPGIPLVSIEFVPGASDDQCVMFDRDTNGACIFDTTYTIRGADVPLIKYFHGSRHKPMLDFSAGTYSAGSRVLINFC